MARFKLLQDLYRFPGFVPQDRIRGLFGDPHAVVITLKRRRKKRFAISVVSPTGPSTTSGPAASATSPVATSGSTSLTAFAESSAGAATA